MNATIINADCLAALREMPDASVDAADARVRPALNGDNA